MTGEKLLFVIGIDQYADAMHPNLKNAGFDAERFAAIMQERYGYQLYQPVLLNEQATLNNIRDGLDNLFQSTLEDDTVVIYFAGHGFQHPDSNIGYWVPYDADGRPRNYIDHSTVVNDLLKLRAKHVLLISDSCYSGTFITQVRGTAIIPTDEELEALKSRWIFVSGAEEKVRDGVEGKGSPFGRSLCGYLQSNQKEVVTASELFNAVTRLTMNLATQKPQCAPMRHGHEGGQIVFRLTVNEAAAAPPAAALPHFALPENPALAHYMARSLSAAKATTDLAEIFFEQEAGRSYMDALLETKRRLVILGTAGTGKSIELQHRAAQWNAAGENRRAIFSRFNTYTDQDISALLPQGWEAVPPEDLCLFLDGLDEIQPVHFHTAVRKLNEFQARHPLVGIVVSCRTNFYELPAPGFSGTLPAFEAYHLNDIRYAEINRHADEHYQVNGEAFLHEAHEQGYGDLVQKPFFLKVLLEHYQRTGGLEIRRSDILESALVEGYTRDREHFLATGQVLTRAHTFALLERIAFVMEVMGRNYLTDDDLAQLFLVAAEYEQCKYLPAFSRDDAKAQWGFDHNNIQEYLASRVLARKPAEELIDLISSEVGGERKVQPHWVNTLSFLISTGEQELITPLLGWLATHDREVVVRFEPDRVSTEQRDLLFRAIYDHYRDQGIWLHSNKFSHRDLARFGGSAASLEYLLTQLNDPESDRNNRLNALAVLRYHPLARQEAHREAVKAAILAQLDLPSWSAQDSHTTMVTLYRLQLNDLDLVADLVARYGNRKNQYIRAGLYNLIQHSADPDAFLQVYLDGLELGGMDDAVDDRESVNLMDESMALSRGLAGLTKPEALTTLFAHFAGDRFHSYFYHRDLVEIMESLMNAAINAYQPDNGLYAAVLGMLQAESRHYQQQVNGQLLRFFDATGNRYRALWDTWSNAEIDNYDKELALRHLIDRQTLEQLVARLTQQNDEEGLRNLHQFLYFQNQEGVAEYLSFVEESASREMAITLERPAGRDWSAIHRERAQSSFDLLFDVAGLQGEVRRIFDEFGLDELDREQLYDWQVPFEQRAEHRFNGAALLILRELMLGGQTGTRQAAEALFEIGDHLTDIRFGHIISKLTNHREIEANQAQVAELRQWCIDHPQEYRHCWFLLKRFDLELPEDLLRGLSRHPGYSQETKLRQPGQLEQLEPYLGQELLHDQVIANIGEPLPDTHAWLTNAGYALRHEIRDAYPLIAAYLLRGEDEYSLNDVLDFWFERTGDIDTLRRMAREMPASYLRWQVVRLLEDRGGEAALLNEVLTGILRDEGQPMEQRIYAANHLLKLNSLEALRFLYERVTAFPEVAFDYRVNLGTFGALTDPAAIPLLTELLLFANRPEVVKAVFNDLESPVLAGLSSIGTHSDEQFVAVRHALQEIMQVHQPQLRYLHFTIANMEEELRKKRSAQLGVREAQGEYQRFIA